MLDLELIREKPDEVKNALLKKMDDVDFTKLIEADDERRKLIREVEVLKNKKNKVSKEYFSNKKSRREC